MKTPAIRPRPDHISELSRGLCLPLPEIQSTHVEIIAEIFSNAFKDLRAEFPAIVESGSEAEVTALLEGRLNRLIGEDSLLCQLVMCVVRGKESLSYDGSHLEKKPDLSIYLTDRARNFPLVTEAKIIDSSTGKTENLYCDQGLKRFVIGEYAWGSREAFMIAYVRDGSVISSKLTPFLSEDMTKSPPKYFVEDLPKASTLATLDLARSKHQRSFLYAHQAPPSNSPGSIALWHLWLT